MLSDIFYNVDLCINVYVRKKMVLLKYLKIYLDTNLQFFAKQSI